MDRDAVARAGRRAQAADALADERGREAALREQITDVVLEQEGARVDAEAFAGLDGDSVRRVRTALGQFDGEPEVEDDPFTSAVYVDFDEEPAEPEEDEVARLEGEIAESQRIQQALESYISALDRSAVTDGA